MVNNYIHVNLRGSSWKGTASNSSAAAHTSRCLSPRCGHVSASCTKLRRRCMKAASRSSRPELTVVCKLNEKLKISVQYVGYIRYVYCR